MSVMNLSALFCTFCSVFMEASEMVLSGMIGYMSVDLTSDLYNLSLLCCERCLNLCILLRLDEAIAARILTCGWMPYVLKLSPRIMPDFVYSSFLFPSCMGVVSLREMGMTLNLPTCVCIFHLFSNVFTCSIALAVVRAAYVYLW